MTDEEMLSRLEQLYGMPEVRNGFPSPDDCLNWANTVALSCALPRRTMFSLPRH